MFLQPPTPPPAVYKQRARRMAAQAATHSIPETTPPTAVHKQRARHMDSQAVTNPIPEAISTDDLDLV